MLSLYQFEASEVRPNKRMKQTSLSAARGQMEAPLRAPHGEAEGRTASQLIRGVRPTRGEREADGDTLAGPWTPRPSSGTGRRVPPTAGSMACRSRRP
jgi:hypothetical protein